MSGVELRDALFIPQDSRGNYKNIVAKRPDLLKRNGGRLAPSLYGTTQNAGLTLGLATSGGDSGFYKAYASGNSDGSQVPVGFLYQTQTVDASGNGSEIVWVGGGQLIKNLLIGLDSGAITSLGGKTYTEQGLTIFDF